MKLYDVIFIAATVAGLSALPWGKVPAEALISGLAIGGYLGWRLFRKE